MFGYAQALHEARSTGVHRVDEITEHQRQAIRHLRRHRWHNPGRLGLTAHDVSFDRS